MLLHSAMVYPSLDEIRENITHRIEWWVTAILISVGRYHKVKSSEITAASFFFMIAGRVMIGSLPFEIGLKQPFL